MIVFIIILLVIIFSYYLKSPSGKGKTGELSVNLKLGKTIEKQKYIIKDLLFKNKNNKTIQIDHILINQKGVFVIETKNYSGKVYGDEYQQEWVQILAYGKQKNYFYNPIKQNKTHIYELKQILPSNIVFHSIIVMANNNSENINSDQVVDLKDLNQKINSIKETFLSIEEMERCYQKLLNLKNNSNVTITEHIKNIKEMEQKVKEGICPRCGGNLIERKGKYGSFKGCSNYPKCKFTQKIERD